MQRSKPRTTRGILLFCLFVFVLLAMPRANVKVGSIPFYMIDGLLALLLVNANSLRRPRHLPRLFAGTVSLLFFFALLSEAAGMLEFGTYQESIYLMIRTSLAFSVFWIVGQQVTTARDVELILRSVVLAVILNSMIMILSSLPMTRGIVNTFIFSNPFLEPAADRVTELFGREIETGVRGRTLVGVSILAASFINVCWPLVALYYRWQRSTGLWKALSLLACLLAPLGVVMSYSRGPLLGSILIVIAVVFLGLRHVRTGIFIPVIAAVAAISTIGIGSQLFFFDRIANRTEAIFAAPLSNERESERALSYTEPFWHAAGHPRFLVVGQGITVRYAYSRIAPEQRGMATHSVFAMGYYSYGMLAAFLYLWLVFRALFYCARHLRPKRGRTAQFLAQPMLLSLIGMLPWIIFGHAAISTPRGAMLLFFILGMVGLITRFKSAAAYHPQVSPQQQGTASGRPQQLPQGKSPALLLVNPKLA